MITKDPKNIIVADDSVFFRAKLRNILEEGGHNVVTVGDGKELVDRLSGLPDKVDLLILDLLMPGMDGFQVLDWINKNGLRGKFSILVATGIYAPTAVVDRLKGLGTNGLMTKVSFAEQIIFRVNRVLYPEKAIMGAKRDRVPVSIAAEFHIGDSTARAGVIMNISDTGVFLHTDTYAPVGAVLELKFALPVSKRAVRARGTVRWATEEIAAKTILGGYGIMFNTISSEDKNAVAKFVATEIERLGLYPNSQYEYA